MSVMSIKENSNSYCTIINLFQQVTDSTRLIRWLLATCLNKFTMA